MVAAHLSDSAQIRARLDHPIIDADGHTIEVAPILMDYLKQVGGNRVLERYKSLYDGANPYDRYRSWRWFRLSEEERRDQWVWCPPWWGVPAESSLDLATASLPRLLHERMDDLGIDFSVLYPTVGFEHPHAADEELRRVGCRALNTYHADYYREYADRMTPAAVIPMFTPQEAIEELEHAVNVLGLKAIVIGYVRRPVPALQRSHPELASQADRLDVLGIDSEHDYDPFWAKCVELGVAPTTHSSGYGWGSRRSPSNYMYNHIGNFASGQEALCKAMFMGGVVRRFPKLKFAFLEGGVGWACGLYADLIGHWKKRNAQQIHRLDPENVDRDLVMELFKEYGGEFAAPRLDEIRRFYDVRAPSPRIIDEWAACGISREEDIRDQFVPNFFFGCEADDPINAWAFNEKVNPLGARLGAMLSSDIGHWDVPDMRDVVAEAYELVEEGPMTERDFRDFAFANAARLWTGANPAFFKGTIVEGDVARLLADSGQNGSGP